MTWAGFIVMRFSHSVATKTLVLLLRIAHHMITIPGVCLLLQLLLAGAWPCWLGQVSLVQPNS